MLSIATRRRGITLIEVIIVIAALVLVAIITIPWIQSARAAARRTECKGNLKQIGLALHNYHDVFTSLPPGFVLADKGIYHGWGWGEMITPFLDAAPYYNQINFGAGLQNEFNKPHMNPALQIYRCVADAGSKHVEHAFVVTNPVVGEKVTPGTTDAVNTFSRSNYFGVAGYLRAEFGGIKEDLSGEPSGTQPYLNAGSLGNQGTSPRPGHRYCDPKIFGGIFGQNSHTRMGEIADGPSSVFMVGERPSPQVTTVNAIGHGTFVGVPDCTTAAGLAMTLGDTSLHVNAGIRAQTTGFGSPHGRGAHFAMADGAVRFISDKMSIIVYRQCSIINDDTSGEEF